MPVQPSENENEYFARLEMQKRLEAQAKRAREMADDEKKRLKELHYLHCPKCGTTLAQERIEDVEVDVCPSCHGVWLDDGELNKLTAEKHHGVFSTLKGIFGKA